MLLLLYIFVIVFNFLSHRPAARRLFSSPCSSPLADILGINQQVVVTTFQLGDGFTNWFFPQPGPLMAGLELGGVTYQQWVKFAAKIIGALVLAGLCFAFLAQMIGLS